MQSVPSSLSLAFCQSLYPISNKNNLESLTLWTTCICKIDSGLFFCYETHNTLVPSDFRSLVGTWLCWLSSLPIPLSISLNFLPNTPHLSPQSVTYPQCFWADRYTHRIHKGATLVDAKQRNLQNFCLQILWKWTPWLCLFLDFFVKHFPNYLSLNYEKLFFVVDF